jgi:hypothetical protein
MKKTIIISVLLLAAISWNASAQALEEKHLNSYDYIQASSGWLTSQNAAGLGMLPVKDMSIVELRGNRVKGGFGNYSGSGDSFTGGAESRSYVRLNKKTVLYGLVSYDYFSGQHMGGSCFVDPYYSSLNVTEYSDTTAGHKLMETYHLVGGFSYNATQCFSIGAKIDYSAVDFAKTKDLRYVDDLMDMKGTVGFKYRTDIVDFGLNYYYRRRVENAKFEVKGTTDKDYYSLIDYGGFFGTWELFGESGITSSSYKTPELSQLHGAALQLEFHFGKNANFFNEFGLRRRNGYLGSTSSARVKYYEHTGVEAEYNGVFSLVDGHNVHAVVLKGLYATLQNYQNIYNIITDNTVTTVNYYGSNLVGDRITGNASVEYIGNFNVKGNYPRLVLRAGADGYYRALRSSVYPNYRDQNVKNFDIHVAGTYNAIAFRHIISGSLLLGYGKGGGYASKDGVYANSSAQPVTVRSTEFYLQREFEYFTTPKCHATASFRYTHFLGKGISVYGDLSDNFLYAPSAVYLGKLANVLALTLGCSF